MNNEIIISCNWKMNPSTLEEAIELTQNIIQYSKHIPKNTKVLLIVPFPFIYCVSTLIKNTNMDAKKIAIESLNIAADICIYTNHNIISETIEL